LHKELSIKDVRSQGGGGFVQCGHFSDKEGSSVEDVRTFGAKNSGFFRNLWCVRTDRGEVGPVLTFCGQGVNFSRIFADVFYEQPLTIEYYNMILKVIINIVVYLS